MIAVEYTRLSYSMGKLRFPCCMIAINYTRGVMSGRVRLGYTKLKLSDIGLGREYLHDCRQALFP